MFLHLRARLCILGVCLSGQTAIHDEVGCKLADAGDMMAVADWLAVL